MHQRTLDALTGVEIWRFEHDPTGRLTAAIDRDGLRTEVLRDAQGLDAIVAPGGQRTEITLDANGYIARIEDPAGQGEAFLYDKGLIVKRTDARGNDYIPAYDAHGRLQSESDPAGGGWTFTTSAVLPVESTVDVVRTSGEGVQTKYHRQPGTHWTEDVATGQRTTSREFPDGVSGVVHPDGTVVAVKHGPDPLLGMQAPVLDSATMITPAGLTMIVTATRTVTEASGSPPVPTALEDTLAVNGRTSTTTFTAATRKVVSRSPEGREVTTTLDASSRPIRVEIAGLAPTIYVYDARGRLQSVSEGEGAAARLTMATYDTKDRLETVTDPAITTAVVPGGLVVAGRV